MADLSRMSDEQLEAENAKLMAARAEVEADFKAKQMAVQAEVTKRADHARLVRIADTLSDADKEALRQHLALPAPEG